MDMPIPENELPNGRDPQNRPFAHTIEVLTSLPLFMGIHSRDMETILGKVRFHFQQAQAGSMLFSEGSTNNQLFFLLEGRIQLTRRSNSSLIVFQETADAPTMLGADVLFGISHHFIYSAESLTPVRYLTVGKPEINHHLLHYEVFRLNLLNHLSLLAQRHRRLLSETLPASIQGRFLQYLQHHFILPAGSKTLQCLQEDLAREILTSERSLRQVLTKYQHASLLEIKRKHIIIPNLQNLLLHKF